MTGISHLLEDFTTETDEQNRSMSGAALEEQRLEAFGSGYKAGWEGAVQAGNDDTSRISSDFAANLQDMSFTIAEARSDLLAALRPLITGMVNSVLPRLMREALGQHVIETLDGMAQTAASGPVELTTAAVNVNALQALIDDHQLSDVMISTQPSLSEGQIFIRVADTEQEVNLDAVLEQIESEIIGFYEEKQKDTA